MDLYQHLDKHCQRRAGLHRQAVVLPIPDNLSQRRHSGSIPGSNHTELRALVAKRIDRLGALLDQQPPNAMKRMHRLGIRLLHGSKVHSRALRGLTDRLGVRRVILVALDKRAHELRRNQSHLVAHRAQEPPQR